MNETLPNVASTASLGDVTLVAAGSGPAVAGWLFAIDNVIDATPISPAIEQIDHLNSSGIIARGDRIYRILSSPSEANASGDFLAYDATGVTTYRRVDGLADSHGLIWDGTHFLVPCSFTNEIWWLSPTGERQRVWRAPGEGDAWHINGLHVRDGRLYASAFGKFSDHRGWAKKIGERTGIIFDVETQETVVEGLVCPHDPIWLDDGWLVCDSYTNRLLLIDEKTGAVRRECQLSGWSRGVTIANDRIFVGVSGERHVEHSKKLARIAVIDRATLTLLHELTLPCAEINALSVIPKSLVGGLRRGFRTNDMRVSVQDRRDLFELAGQGKVELHYTPMRALQNARDFRVRIHAKAPRRVLPGDVFNVEVRIKNRSRVTLFTAAPFPVNLAVVFELIGPNGPITETNEVRREPLPEAALPGKTLRFTFKVQSPQTVGKYRVRFTLVQEWVRWFDTDQRFLARLISSNRRYLPMTVDAQSS